MVRLIAGVDIETTGLLTGDHRIIEICIGLYDLDTQKLLKTALKRIDPLRSISIEAQRVHGITPSELVGCPTWEIVAPEVAKWLNRSHAIVAHNGREFDMPFINSELRRVGLPPVERPVFDTMKDARWATALGKVPTLGELCFALDVPYDTSKAHAADFDVQVMMNCFFRGLEWGWFKLGDDLASAA